MALYLSRVLAGKYQKSQGHKHVIKVPPTFHVCAMRLWWYTFGCHRNSFITLQRPLNLIIPNLTNSADTLNLIILSGLSQHLTILPSPIFRPFYIEAAIAAHSTPSLVAVTEFMDLQGRKQMSLLENFLYAAALSSRPSKELFSLVLVSPSHFCYSLYCSFHILMFQYCFYLLLLLSVWMKMDGCMDA